MAEFTTQQRAQCELIKMQLESWYRRATADQPDAYDELPYHEIQFTTGATACEDGTRYVAVRVRESTEYLA